MIGLNNRVRLLTLSLLFSNYNLLSGQGMKNVAIETFKFYESHQIIYDANKKDYRYFELVPGPYTVFEFYANNAGDPGNFSAAETKIVFQIAPDIDSFYMSGDEISRIYSGCYIQLCKCQDIGIQPVTNGWIKGIKMSETAWDVDLNITVVGWLSDKVYTFVRSELYLQADQ